LHEQTLHFGVKKNYASQVKMAPVAKHPGVNQDAQGCRNGNGKLRERSEVALSKRAWSPGEAIGDAGAEMGQYLVLGWVR